MIKIVLVGVKKPDAKNPSRTEAVSSYTLLEGKTYEVGRKEGDMTFPDDQSISRHHAQIFVDHPIANITNVSLIPNVCVTDLGSKFGTFVNEGIERKTALSMREKMNLSEGDRFRFGLQWNEFKIEYTPLIATSSAVRDIQNLKKDICKLGAHLLPEWTDKCDFVIMESVTLTIKAVCALLSAKRIVTPAYFKDLIACHETGKPNFPNPSDFLPVLAEKPLKDHPISFDPDPNRSKLFEGRIFMFVNTKHLRKLAVAVESGGGKTLLVTSATSAELKSPKSLLMALVVDNSTLEQSTLDCIEAYKKCGKRAIPESEIGLAAVHCSTEKHCNPFYNFTKAVMPTPRMISQTQASSASSTSNSSFRPVPETQDMLTQKSVQSYSIDVVEETMVSPSTGFKSSSSSVDDISIDSGNPGPSRRPQNSKKRQDDDFEERPLSKKRLPQRETFLEPSIKKARKEPVTKNKTLSILFDSSDDEDEDAPKVEDKIVEPNPSETMDVDQNSVVDRKIEAHSVNAEVTEVVSPTPATLDRTAKSTPLHVDTQEDLFPTDVSVKDSPSVRSKRKLEEDEEVPKNRPKTRKVNAEIQNQTIQEKIKNLNISKKPVLSVTPKTENSSEEISNEVIEACPTVFMKPVLIERRPPERATNTAGKTVVNYKKFKKVTPLNSSLRANSLHENSISIKLILDGDENNTSMSFSKNTVKDITHSIIDTNQDQADQSALFEDDNVSASREEPQPSTSRRATRSGTSSPSKPAPSRTSKKAAAKPTDSIADFEEHVEGGSRLTRSRRGNVSNSPSPPKPVRKKKQPEEEIQDMWSF